MNMSGQLMVGEINVAVQAWNFHLAGTNFFVHLLKVFLDLIDQNKACRRSCTGCFEGGTVDRPLDVRIHVHVIPQAILAALLALELEHVSWLAHVLTFRGLVADHTYQESIV